MRKIPPLNALKSFEATARNGSFRGAAEELCVSVSAISHQIKTLESYLNMELFHRHARAISLTESGKKYYPVLRDAFEKISDGTVSLLQPQASNNIIIHLYSTIAIRWLIPKLPDFQQRYPEINVRLHTSSTDVDFEHSDVDACIKITDRTEPELEHHYLFTSQLFPVCSPKMLQSRPELTQLDNLKEATILQVHPSKDDWHIWQRSAGIEEADADSGLRFDSYDHALTTALQGLGFAMGMQPYVKNELESGLLVEPFPTLRTKHIASWYFVCRKEKSNLRKVTLFREWLVNQILEDGELASLRQ
jgi:LysR family glycine cleavage system transcriptional activator